MAATPVASPLSPALAARIAEHQAERARLREEFGDPEAALDAWVRETFDRDALIATYEEYMKGEGLWDEVDDDPIANG